ncbi:hypothetical protein Tco_1196554, partial [Tanacetum coccineum]
MRELREDTFSGTKNDDAHVHVERVLDILSLFNTPGVTHDTVMLRVFHITLTGAAKRCLNGNATIASKQDSLGRDVNKLKENVHDIQVGYGICEGAHLDKDCPLNEEVKRDYEVKYGEFERSFPNNGRNGGRYRV